ncbi:Argininosuccinate lyase [Delftia tsuruhatensis]|nr:Argininosuccinate lyase [Delftia tsuruhatensis]
MHKRLFTTALAAGLLATTALSGALAQDRFPAKSVRWIVPYAAGGGSDFLARTIGQAWGGQVHQPIVVDNRPGGNTAIGASETARAPADGYTVLSADNGTLVFNPVLYKSLSYNPSRDLAPVTLMGRFPMILVAGPGMAAASAREFLALARTSKDGVNYASAGAGSPHHLAMELLKVEAGLKLVHAPYKGAAPALGDVAGGQVPVMMVDLGRGCRLHQGRQGPPAGRGQRHAPAPAAGRAHLRRTGPAQRAGRRPGGTGGAGQDAGPGHRGPAQAGGGVHQ